jgi:hypothetical protein
MEQQKMTPELKKKDAVESHLEDVQVENDLLVTQIHQLEEELEHYFNRNQELENHHQARSSSNETGKMLWVDEELPEAIAENQRLHALVEVLRKTHQLEKNNSLNVKLGNILIQGTNSPGTLFAIPAKIGKIWRESSRTKVPKVLGGQGYDKVITAHSDEGFKAVEKLLARVSAPTIQANAYTALARNIMNNDRVATAEAARRAYEMEPRPFRLKWLAFRLHEAGDVIEAEAMLDILPNDIKFSESEARQASQLRNDAKHVRLHEAKQKNRFSERRSEGDRQLSQFKELYEEENELLLLQLHQAQEELEHQYLKCQTLEQAQRKLEKEKLALADQNDELVKLAEERQEQIDKLTQEKAIVEEEHGQELASLKQAMAQNKEESELFQRQIYDELESLSINNETLVLESSVLTEAKAAVESERDREVEAQKQAQLKLKQEMAALIVQKDEQSKLATDQQAQIEKLMEAKAAVESERGREIEAQKEAQLKLEQEMAALIVQKDEQSKLVTAQQAQIEKLMEAKAAVESERGREIETQKEAQMKLEQEMAALIAQKDEQSKMVTDQQAQIEQLMEAKAAVESECGREIEAQKEAQMKLEQEMAALVNQRDEQGKLTAQLYDDLRKSGQAASLSLKLQMLREADLKDLQTRYRESRAQEEHQHQLLTKLEERLSTASVYFNQIASNDPRILIQEENNIQSKTAVDPKNIKDPIGNTENNS